MIKNLKINGKLIVGFGSILFFLFISLVVAFSGLNKMASQVDQYAQHTVPDTNDIWQIRRDLVSLQRYMLIALTENDPESIRQNLDVVSSEATRVAATLENYKSNARADAKEIEALDILIKKMPIFRAEISELLKKGDVTSNSLAFKIFKNDYKPLIDEAGVIMEQIAINQVERGNNQAATAERSEKVSITLLIVVAVVSITLTFFIIIAIKRAILVPVLEVEKAAKALASGDLGTTIAYRSRDELGSLAASTLGLSETLSAIIKDLKYVLGNMADGNFRVHTTCEDKYVGEYGEILKSMLKINHSLSGTLSQINQASDQVLGGSHQVSDGAQALSQGATEQASSVEELAANINQISAQVNENAKNAEQASVKAGTVGVEAADSNRRMQDMLTAMTDISSSSKEIGKIIKTIEDIAFQTNILALNAAVEAARAGTAGKGFAVVADEVRNLASKSAEASKNTASLIAGSLKAVETGTKIADDAATSLGKVVEGIHDVGKTINGISSASTQQAEGINQINTGIDQIASVVQTNSATAEESAAASEELSSQSQMLKSLVGSFKLMDTGKFY